MGFLKKISAIFGDAKGAAPDEARDSIAGMTTPEGRAQHLQYLAEHPDCLNLRDARGKTALDHAALAGDTNTMTQLIALGISKDFYNDAISAACVAGSQPALTLLLASGGVVTDQQLSTLRIVAGVTGPAAGGAVPQSGGDQCDSALAMMESAYAVQEADRQAEAAGPTVLGRDMRISAPLKLTAPAKA